MVDNTVRHQTLLDRGRIRFLLSFSAVTYSLMGEDPAHAAQAQVVPVRDAADGRVPRRGESQTRDQVLAANPAHVPTACLKR